MDHGPWQKVHGRRTAVHSKEDHRRWTMDHSKKSTVDRVRHSLFGEGVQTAVHGKKAIESHLSAPKGLPNLNPLVQHKKHPEGVSQKGEVKAYGLKPVLPTRINCASKRTEKDQ